MYQIIITVETREQAEEINEVVSRAEVSGKLDFPFNTEIGKVMLRNMSACTEISAST